MHSLVLLELMKLHVMKNQLLLRFAVALAEGDGLWFSQTKVFLSWSTLVFMYQPRITLLLNDILNKGLSYFGMCKCSKLLHTLQSHTLVCFSFP